MEAILTQTAVTQPRIYVACLAAYNSGHLHGVWIDAAQDAWSIWGAVSAMLASSPVEEAEEYAINDYEGFEGVRIREHTGIDEVAQMAAFVAEQGRMGALLLNELDGDMTEARAAIEDRYLGCYESLADYMQEVTEETTSIPDHLRCYIDWQAMARDAELAGDLFTVQTASDAVHVFAGS